MTLKFKDASDFKGRDVNENLYNLVLNSNRLSGSNDIILSIHFNGFNEKATGAETWSYLGDSISKPIAQRISREVASAQGIVDRGQKSTTDLYVVSQTNAHMILVEVCFLDNYNEIQNYIKNKNRVIDAIVKACEAYPQYNFTATHGGHYGLNMMDPGVSRHGYKEAVLAQEINQALLKNKQIGGGTTVTKPKQPQGDWIAENKRVEVTTKNQNTFLDFKWKVCHPTNQILGKQYVVTGKYNHQNGETYYSLYDVEGSWHGYINKKFVKEIKAIYQTIPGLYEALKDDTFYIDQNLKKKSAWKIKRGQTFHLEDIVAAGKYTRAKVRLNNDIRYCTMRDDYWKLKYKTKVVKIK